MNCEKTFSPKEKMNTVSGYWVPWRPTRNVSEICSQLNFGPVKEGKEMGPCRVNAPASVATARRTHDVRVAGVNIECRNLLLRRQIMNHPTTQDPSIVGRPLARRPIWGFLGVCFVLITMFVALAPQVWGQENATINGTISDTTGALVPNAAISSHQPCDRPGERVRLELLRAPIAFRTSVSAPTPERFSFRL
jgi:hypothetical protein